MAPIGKENEVLTISPGLSNSSSTPRPDETANRPQPVALEVPVTVNGARTVEGSDKREPFSEATKTVLVFGNGAVIRLGSSVAAGQLLFLTNEKTKKEVVCQVVKSKNYRSASGYVELEFTEPVVGFWGMRFPSDGLAPPARPVAPPVATKNPVAAVPPSKPAGPVIAPASRSPEPAPLPASTPSFVAASPVIPADSEQTTRAPEAPATRGPEPPVTHAAGISTSLATSLADLLGEDEPEKPASPPRASTPSVLSQTSAPTAAANETETLKQQTARLQEQLSSMLFSAEKKSGASAPPAQAPDAKPTSGGIKRVMAMAKVEPAVASPISSAKPVPPPVKSSLDAEEVKIPAWLEPLARNAAAPASTQELIEREKARHAAQIADRDEATEEIVEEVPASATGEPALAAPDLPAFGSSFLSLDEQVANEDRPSGKSGKSLMFGSIAAGVLLAAGGAWYFLHASNHGPSVAASTASAAGNSSHAAASLPPSQPPADLNAQPSQRPATVETAVEAPKPNTAVVSQPVVERSTLPQAPVGTASKASANSQPAAPVRGKSQVSGTEIPAAEKEAIANPATEPGTPPEPKKPALGEVHLASPTLNRHVAPQNEGEAAPTLAPGADVPSMNGLNTDLGAGSKEASAPAAPLPVGGEVKPARLLSQVQPIYPMLAKNQRVSGDVVIDALIDANGKVTSMKVISGPALLHQAAKDALRQWKFQPATLDGSPVSMHLTVKLQFRIP